MVEVFDRLEQGRLDARLSLAVTRGMRGELDMWAEVAGWSLAKTVRYLLALAMRTFEPDAARDYRLEGGQDE
jgi:hypothetical protein